MDTSETKPESDQKTQDVVDELIFKSRFVLIYGEINHLTARATTERLIALAAESDAPINVLISSPGGHVESGDAIHDMINFISAPVTTVGTGWVASAGTHVFLAAPKERRVCLPNTRFMIHQPSGGCGRIGIRYHHSGKRDAEDARARGKCHREADGATD